MIAIWFVWSYGALIQSRAWQRLSFAMLPALVGAMCACTWHFFDNPLSLEWLVVLQASMTFLGNTALCGAAWLIWRQTRPAPDPTGPGSLPASKVDDL